MKGASLKELNILYLVMIICTVYIDFLHVFWSGEGYSKGLKKPASHSKLNPKEANRKRCPIIFRFFLWA